jgi:hypothetical protein
MKIEYRLDSFFEKIEEIKRTSVPNGKFQHLQVDNFHWIMAPDGTHGNYWHCQCPARLSFEGKEYIAFTEWFGNTVCFPVGVVFEMKKVD